MEEGLEEGASAEAGHAEEGGDADEDGENREVRTVITMIQELVDVAATGMLLCILSNF